MANIAKNFRTPSIAIIGAVEGFHAVALAGRARLPEPSTSRRAMAAVAAALTSNRPKPGVFGPAGQTFQPGNRRARMRRIVSDKFP